MGLILIADDELKMGRPLARALEAGGHTVVLAPGGRQAVAEIAARAFDLVLTDLCMPEVDGLAVLRAARARTPPAEVVVMTAFGTTESAVAAMKAGAADYLLKPFSMDELSLRVSRLLEKTSAEAKARRLQDRLTPQLVACSPRMAEALEAATRVARSDASVLLLGESGTGKTQLARYIHYTSSRASGPIVEVHCAALPETLLEAELFGHEKGAFTGAYERKSGLLAAADGGTLFLDEIGEITNAMQVKLLRFLDSREFAPLGSAVMRRIDVRLVAATNRDLAAAVRQGAFREDFFYRLNVFAIEVPPLRDHREDVIPVAEAFLRKRGLPPSKLTPGAREELSRRAFPGNVRELENALERALILAGPENIAASHVTVVEAVNARTQAADVIGPGFDLDNFERDLLYAALQRTGGNKAAAARLLGITRRRLRSRLQSLTEKDSADSDEPG